MLAVQTARGVQRLQHRRDPLGGRNRSALDPFLELISASEISNVFLPLSGRPEYPICRMATSSKRHYGHHKAIKKKWKLKMNKQKMNNRDLSTPKTLPCSRPYSQKNYDLSWHLLGVGGTLGLTISE